MIGRGFVFTIDMIYGSLVVVLLVSVMVNTANPLPPPEQILLQMQAKDAAIAWFYGAPASTPLNPDDKPMACDLAFRPRVTTEALTPGDGSDWVSQSNCVVAP